MLASDGGQGQYSVSILDGWLGSGGWAAGNLEDKMMTSSLCLLWDAVDPSGREKRVYDEITICKITVTASFSLVMLPHS